MTREDGHLGVDLRRSGDEGRPVAVPVVADREHAAGRRSSGRPEARVDAEAVHVHAAGETRVERLQPGRLTGPVEHRVHPAEERQRRGAARTAPGVVEQARDDPDERRLEPPSQAPRRERDRRPRRRRDDDVRLPELGQEPLRPGEDGGGRVRREPAATGLVVDQPAGEPTRRRIGVDLVVRDLVPLALELDRAEEELGRALSRPRRLEAREPAGEVDEGDPHRGRHRVTSGVDAPPTLEASPSGSTASPRPSSGAGSSRPTSSTTGSSGTAARGSSSPPTRPSSTRRSAASSTRSTARGT